MASLLLALVSPLPGVWVSGLPARIVPTGGCHHDLSSLTCGSQEGPGIRDDWGGFLSNWALCSPFNWSLKGYRLYSSNLQPALRPSNQVTAEKFPPSHLRGRPGHFGQRGRVLVSFAH